MQVSFWCSINGEFVSGILNFGRICSNIDDGRFDALKCRKRIRNSMFGYNYSPIILMKNTPYHIYSYSVPWSQVPCDLKYQNEGLPWYRIYVTFEGGRILQEELEHVNWHEKLGTKSPETFGQEIAVGIQRHCLPKCKHHNLKNDNYFDIW